MEQRIRCINPNARIIRTEYSLVDPKVLLNVRAFSLERVLEMDPEFLLPEAEHVHDDSVSSVAWRFPDFEVNVNKMEMWI